MAAINNNGYTTPNRTNCFTPYFLTVIFGNNSLHQTTKFLFFGLLLLSNIALAQGKFTGESESSYQQRMRNKAVTDAERVKSTPNTPAATSVNTNSKEYLQALGESDAGKAWAKLLNNEKTPAELEAKKAREEYQRKLDNENIRVRELAIDKQHRMWAEARRRTGTLEYRLINAGFVEDIEKWPYRTYQTNQFLLKMSNVMPDGILEDAKEEQKMLLIYNSITSSKKSFDENKSTESFNVLIDYISGYMPMWYTALTDLDVLAKRFPENLKQIDSQRLLAYCYYLGLDDNSGFPTYEEMNSKSRSALGTYAIPFGTISLRNPGVLLSLFAKLKERNQKIDYLLGKAIKPLLPIDREYGRPTKEHKVAYKHLQSLQAMMKN